MSDQQTPSPQTPPVRRREIAAWAMFDFANSSYTTIIVTIAFSNFFTQLIAPAGRGDFLWGSAIAIGNLIVLLLSPIVGSIADDSGRKKLFLGVTYVLCVVGTALLWYVTPGQALLGLVLVVISFVGFSFSENLTAAFLPEISTPANIGRISGFGWGLGYFGGLGSILLVRSLISRGWTLENLPNLRVAWVVTAAFFAVSALPTFLFLKERAPKVNRPLSAYVRAGFQRLGETAQSIRDFSELARFLTVFFVFSCGLTSVFAFSGIYASKTLGFTNDELSVLFLVLQLSAAGGAFLFGFIQDRFGAGLTIRAALILWVVVCAGTYACGAGSAEVAFGYSGKQLFWGVGLLSGLGIGSLQSASRGLVGLFSPVEKSGEFFGFWGLAGKAAYMVGPFLFGVISSLTSQRIAILSTSVFFLLGLIGMRWVNEARGRAEVVAWNTARGSKETAA